jgi:hypothetical protein
MRPRYFLFQLAPHAFVVSAGLGRIVGRDVTPDANAALAVQPAFALALAAGVLKKASLAVGVAMPENDVWNELLKARVLLHGRSRLVAGV